MKYIAFLLVYLSGCSHLGFTQQRLTKYLLSVVSIKVYSEKADSITEAKIPHNWVATGFSILSNEDGSLILTNKHVCSDRAKSRYILNDSFGKQHDAVFIRTDDNADLCLLKTTAKIPSLTLAKQNSTRGSHILVIGAPHGEFPYFTEGYVSGYFNIKTEDMDSMDVEIHFRACATSAPIYGGSSGSPVIDEYENVVGVIFAGIKNSDHMSYMVPVNLIREFLDTSQNVYSWD